MKMPGLTDNTDLNICNYVQPVYVSVIIVFGVKAPPNANEELKLHEETCVIEILSGYTNQIYTAKFLKKKLNTFHYCCSNAGQLRSIET